MGGRSSDIENADGASVGMECVADAEQACTMLELGLIYIKRMGRRKKEINQSAWCSETLLIKENAQLVGDYRSNALG